ncbi:prepilin-type N-terminal cleavage/methylation domain-containing protein [Candidatus Saccharibacteria bacterium]|nr:prepilin-type N-terminal cleavage/methylation domain-containing protein [Candidatus Saccharibacteria bacterium]
MIRRRRGFTLVEVSLFLAITAASFVGIVAGTQSSIFQQRYNDAVQSFVDF